MVIVLVVVIVFIVMIGDVAQPIDRGIDAGLRADQRHRCGAIAVDRHLADGSANFQDAMLDGEVCLYIGIAGIDIEDPDGVVGSRRKLKRGVVIVDLLSAKRNRVDRRVVDLGDVERELVRGRVEIDAAVDGAAVILHLEGESGEAVAVVVVARRPDELAGVEFGDGDHRASSDGDAGECQLAGAGKGRDPDRQQALAGLSCGSAKPKSAACRVTAVSSVTAM